MSGPTSLHLSPHFAGSQKCSVCDIREGACIQCSKNSCFLAYHVTCARKERLLMPMKASSGLEPPPLQCFCERHMPVSHALSRCKRLLTSTQSENDLKHAPRPLKLRLRRNTLKQSQANPLAHMPRRTSLVHLSFLHSSCLASSSI